MDFIQSKLSKNEWESIEKPVDDKEKKILDIIIKGYNDPDYSVELFLTIGNVIKLDHDEKDYYIYINILKSKIDSLIKMYKLDTILVKAPKKKLNGADTIRIQSQQKKQGQNQIDCVDNYILDMIEKFFKEKKKEFYLYNICMLVKKYKINVYLSQFVELFITKYNSTMDIMHFLENTNKYIENNSIFDYKPLKLYEHQQKIYEAVKLPEPKLIIYRAPTSSGKTLTPLGLCEQYKVIFMCASRHIGVNLAKSGVNVGRKIGFAFGCNTTEDIRLHYFSVNSYIISKGRKRPDHSDGSKLELLICDIQSYEVAMLYMLSFFKKEQIILFWDDATISMNRDTHPLHNSITSIWEFNVIQNIILTSATLPNKEDLTPLFEKFKAKYNGSIHYIETQDENTNITLLDSSGNVVMPHNIFSQLPDLYTFIDKHAYSHSKYLSVSECASFILYVCRNVFKKFDIIAETFTTIQTITAQNIRDLYYKVCRNIKSSEWSFIVESYLNYKKVKTFDIGNDITTKYSHTLTYGPTIYLCEDIQRWVNYFVENSAIHLSVFKELEQNIDSNNEIIDKIVKKKKTLEDKTLKDEENENKMKEQRFDPATKQLIEEISTLERSLKEIQLNALYIPNSKAHFEKWTSKNYEGSNVFTSNVEEQYVRRIMNLSIDTNYKILLLMGIGIFNPAIKLDEYNEIMKELAEQKQLLFIIAGSDYIHGTNYQFSHGYLADDILNINQETIIQSIGRVGRKEKNMSFTFRFRDNSIIKHLFVQTNDIEIRNINALFF